jgi:hypothetical protein
MARQGFALLGQNLTDDSYWFTGFGSSLVQARFMADPHQVLCLSDSAGLEGEAQ